MAEDKKGILVYADWIDQFEGLTDEEAGQLIKHFFRYVNDLDPIAPDRIIEVAFRAIKNSLKRDLEKWNNKKQERSLSGRIGNLKKYHEDLYSQFIDNQITIEEAESIANARKSSHSDKKPRIANKSVAKLAVNVTVNGNVINNNIFTFEEFWNLYPNKVARKKCEAKFKTLSDTEKTKIKETLPNFVSYKPFKEYNHPNPETYLNQSRWDDVIPILQLPSEKTKEQEREEKEEWFRKQGF